MAKSSVIRLDYNETRDSDTGCSITRLTPKEITCHRNYFYQKCFTADSKKLIFSGEFDRNWNYYLLDIDHRLTTQLTEGPGDNTFGGFLSPDDHFLYFMRAERSFLRLDMSTLAEEVIYTVPEGWLGYGTWVANSACTKVAGIEMFQRDSIPLSDWIKFGDQFQLKPLCRLIVVDMVKGKSRVLFEDRIWLGHPLYRPFDDHIISFCHEGPHDLVDSRIWFINEEGTNIRRAYEQKNGEYVTHEFWVGDGSRMIFVSYQKGKHDRMICSIDPDTMKNREIMSMPPCSHIMSNFKGDLIVGDGSGTPQDVSDSESFGIENDPFIYLFDLNNKSYCRVAKHGSSWGVYKGSRQVTHPHPSFSPDEQKVLFTSDREGKPAVYLGDLPH